MSSPLPVGTDKAFPYKLVRADTGDMLFEYAAKHPDVNTVAAVLVPSASGFMPVAILMTKFVRLEKW